MVDQRDHDAIAAFWAWFVEHEADLRRIDSRSAPMLDELIERLQLVDPGLWGNVSTDTEVADLIIKAEGNVDLFLLVDTIVAAAPQVDGWTFQALQPPMGFEFTIEDDVVGELAPQELWFLPLESRSNPRDLGLRIGVPPPVEGHETRIGFLVLQMLDIALGERTAAQEIDAIEVVALPIDPAGAGYIELVELPEYIEWRNDGIEKRRGPR